MRGRVGEKERQEREGEGRKSEKRGRGKGERARKRAKEQRVGGSQAAEHKDGVSLTRSSSPISCILSLTTSSSEGIVAINRGKNSRFTLDQVLYLTNSPSY